MYTHKRTAKVEQCSCFHIFYFDPVEEPQLLSIYFDVKQNIKETVMKFANFTYKRQFIKFLFTMCFTISYTPYT